MTAPFKLTHLQPGDRLRVIQGFTDFDGVAWAEGQTLEFVDRSYVPYDGGYTFTFREGTLRLAHIDAANDRLLRSPEEYFARVAPGAYCRPTRAPAGFGDAGSSVTDDLRRCSEVMECDGTSLLEERKARWCVP